MQLRAPRGLTHKSLPGLLLVLALTIPCTPAQAAAPGPLPCEGGPGSTGIANPESHQIESLSAPAGGILAEGGSPGMRTTALNAAQAYLERCASVFGISNAAGQLRAAHQYRGLNAHTIQRFQRTINGIPVFGGEVVVDLDARNNIIAVNADSISRASTGITPRISASRAAAIAIAEVAGEQRVQASRLSASPPQLWFYDPASLGREGGSNRLVWRIGVVPTELAPIDYLVLVDAISGGIALSINQVDTLMGVSPRYTTAWTSPSTQALRCAYDPEYGQLNSACDVGDLDAQRAHVFAGDTLDLFYTVLGRQGIDDHYMTVSSYVHTPMSECNAYWAGTAMVYGNYYDPACELVTDDVVGHELTHGVTAHTSQLVYAGQSGAINESMSDIFGEWVDQNNPAFPGNKDGAAYNWQNGEDSSYGVVRDMKDPAIHWQPDRMGSPLYYKGRDDYGGVHTNSGVGNKAAFLIVEGGTFNGRTITGIGWDKAIHIYYQAELTLTSTSDYRRLANTLWTACNGLIGSFSITADDCASVLAATKATEMLRSITITGNTGLGGVTLSWNDGGKRSTVADANGNYMADVASAWNGTITAKLAHYRFAPRRYNSMLADAFSQDFTPVPELITISGSTGIGGATITWDGDDPVHAVSSDGSTLANRKGKFSFKVPYSWTGNVSVTAGCAKIPDARLLGPVTKAVSGLSFVCPPD